MEDETVTTLRLSGLVVAMTLGICIGANAQTPVEVGASGGTALVMNWESVEWEPPSSRPGFPDGLRNAPVANDPETGGITYLARFPAGSRFDMHWHTYTETVVVLQGSVDVVIEGTRYTATEGSYIILPGGAHHEWQVPPEADVVLLARRDGPADFHLLDP
jgi:quercetin dioxygenase-like cupin family protein